MEYTNKMACNEVEISQVTSIKFKKIVREICAFIMNRGTQLNLI